MKRNLAMEMVNLNEAGIDVGSKSHFVSIGQKSGEVKHLWFT